MVRKLGEILVERFGWEPTQVDAALNSQRCSNAWQAIGTILKAGSPTRAREVDRALLVQARERISAEDPAERFLVKEYERIDLRIQHSRQNLTRLFYYYGLMFVVLLLFVAYPLNRELAQGGQAVASAPAPGGAFDPNAVAADTDTPLVLAYSILGLALVAFLLFLGLHVVAKVGRYFKDRYRVEKAHVAIRSHFLQGADWSVLPLQLHYSGRSEAHEGGRLPEPSSRPEPDITRLQRATPLAYCFWSIPKLLLAIYFSACLWEKDLVPDAPSLWAGVLIMAGVGLLWIWISSDVCERFHKDIKEGRAICPRNPSPRYSTQHLRYGIAPRDVKMATMGFFLAYVVGFLMWIVAAGLFYWKRNDNPEVWGILGIGGFLLFAACSVMHSLYRASKMKLLEPRDGDAHPGT
jgi:hypothetical protein